jgi:hypothetical protein
MFAREEIVSVVQSEPLLIILPFGGVCGKQDRSGF